MVMEDENSLKLNDPMITKKKSFFSTTIATIAATRLGHLSEPKTIDPNAVYHAYISYAIDKDPIYQVYIIYIYIYPHVICRTRSKQTNLPSLYTKYIYIYIYQQLAIFRMRSKMVHFIKFRSICFIHIHTCFLMYKCIYKVFRDRLHRLHQALVHRYVVIYMYIYHCMDTQYIYIYIYRLKLNPMSQSYIEESVLVLACFKK